MAKSKAFTLTPKYVRSVEKSYKEFKNGIKEIGEIVDEDALVKAFFIVLPSLISEIMEFSADCGEGPELLYGGRIIKKAVKFHDDDWDED